MSDQPRRIAELDGLRGIAIVLVVLWHYVGCMAAPGTQVARILLIPARVGWSGVDLFFVLSGFLVGGILLDVKTSPRYFRTFYTRRAARILPVYYAMLVLFAGGLSALGSSTRFAWLFGSPLPLGWYFVVLQNVEMAITHRMGANFFAVTWSLAVEEQFYLVLPLVVRWVRHAAFPRWLALAAVVAPLVRAWFMRDGSETNGGYVLLVCRADALALGVLVAWLRRAPAWHAIDARPRLVDAGVALVLLAALGFGQVFGSATGPIGSLRFSLFALLYALVLVRALVSADSWWRRLLSAWPLRAFGVGAYGIYILHQAVLGLWHGAVFGAPPTAAGGAQELVTGAALATTLALAALSWRFFEKPLIRWGHQFGYWPEKQLERAVARG